MKREVARETKSELREKRERMNTYFHIKYHLRSFVEHHYDIYSTVLRFSAPPRI